MGYLCCHYHIIGCRKAVRSITRKCVACHRTTIKPQHQLLGQLPSEWLTPGFVFENVGVDNTGPFHIKYGSVRKRTIIKAYVCIFVSLLVKAVHSESISDLTTDASLPLSDESLLVAVNPLSFGVTTEQTSPALPANARKCRIPQTVELAGRRLSIRLH